MASLHPDHACFVGCNLNPDPSGGTFNAPPLTDKWWYPFYEKMIELREDDRAQCAGDDPRLRLLQPRASARHRPADQGGAGRQHPVRFEMVGAVKGIDPKTGQCFDDTGRHVDATPNLSAADRQKVFEGNALKVYPRLKAQIEKQARGNG